jgi:hypothetical protein
LDSLLGVESDNERRNVDDLLTDPDVPLPDEDSGVVDRLGESIYQHDIPEPPRHPNMTYPSLKTWVCNRRSKKSSVFKART